MGAIRVGVKKLEDTVEEDRAVQLSLNAELRKEKQELEAVKLQLESIQSSKTDTSLQLDQVNKALVEVTQELEDERAKSLSLARDLRSAVSKALASEKSTVSQYSFLESNFI